MCGLKPWFADLYHALTGHTLRGCVDWNNNKFRLTQAVLVTPCVGVWIETTKLNSIYMSNEVTPCVGVWIETSSFKSVSSVNSVTPCVGVWIETFLKMKKWHRAMSHPAWVCGLKPITRVLWKYSMSHTLRGCVDWNIRTMTAMYPYVVTPCVGVWIETTRSANFSFKSPCHTLRGCVDWN